MVAMLKCPNCGAPLQGSGMVEQRACAYCGALLHVPKPAPAMQVPRTQPQAPQSSRGILVAAIFGLLSLALAAGVATFRTMMSSMSPAAVPQATPAVAARAAEAAVPPKVSGVAWNRLEGIDIHATVDQAEVALKQQFPEAKVEQDKDYRIDLDHPILSNVFYS